MKILLKNQDKEQHLQNTYCYPKFLRIAPELNLSNTRIAENSSASGIEQHVHTKLYLPDHQLIIPAEGPLYS